VPPNNVARAVPAPAIFGLKRISDRQEAGLVFFQNPEAEQRC
jgi:hypothetical protein